MTTNLADPMIHSVLAGISSKAIEKVDVTMLILMR